MSGKREINGVFMIPFGLVAGFADGQEIRITEIAEHGFCFRTLDEIREVKRFRICFYDGFNGMKTGDQEKKSRDPYTEVEIHWTGNSGICVFGICGAGEIPGMRRKPDPLV